MQTQSQVIKKLKGEDRINYWKWGLISLAVVIGIGLIWWGYKRIRN